MAFAFSYALVHAGAKSGTNAGFSTGGGCFGELAGYTPGIGGSDDGEGKGANAYGVLGMTDGPGSVSTLILVVVEGTEEDVDELLLPKADKLARLDVVVTKKDEGVEKEGEDKLEGEVVASARAAARRTRTAGDHMDVNGGTLWASWRGREKGRTTRGRMKGKSFIDRSAGQLKLCGEA